MTRDVITCSETDTMNEIMERMTTGKFRHIPVVDQGRLVGIVSIGDVVKHRLNEMEAEFGGAAGLHPDGMIADVMPREGGASSNHCLMPSVHWIARLSRAMTI